MPWCLVSFCLCFTISWLFVVPCLKHFLWLFACVRLIVFVCAWLFVVCLFVCVVLSCFVSVVLFGCFV